VDGWPMAITIQKTFGGQPKLVTALGCDGRLVSPSGGVHVAVGGSLSRAQPPGLRRTTPWGTQWVAIGWPAQRPGGFGRGDAVGPGVGRALPDRSTILAPPGGLPGGPRFGG